MLKSAASRFLLLPVLALSIRAGAGAETFVYHYQEGAKYRILSVVDEDVYVNHRFSHRARILNRIAVELSDVAGGKARHTAVFATSEQAESGRGGFRWGKEYPSVFDRDAQGHITIAPEYFMPVVRDVPVFPRGDIKAGETWTAQGHEVHDFRVPFGIPDPYRIPFEASYRFLGPGKWKEKTRQVFSVSYRIFFEPPPAGGEVWPRRIMGASDQLVYWDMETGQPAAYTERFRMVFELSDGTIVEYRGRAEAEILESEPMDKEKTAREITGEIKRRGIEGVSVRVVDEGVTISLENIQFQAESAALLPGEKEKLDKIGAILKGYADRDILVGGHTALAGSPEGRQKLSLERAAAVSDYLAARNVRRASQMVVRGYGAEQPLGDNATPEGMAKNRRVEITILEN
ncbi:MAG: OmpA family protein [Treponema sp.]|jgi:outer membrane protein OmpA-like peptidoglycan-associated protein|nr:OmpA family protein [Treponema sp.]